MERTELFKALVKTVRLRLRAQKKDTSSLNESILHKKVNKDVSEFGRLARDTCNHITALKQFLIAHRKDYIDTSSHLSQEFSHMSDKERDLIDNEAQNLIKKTSEYFNCLRRIINVDQHKQCLQHRKCVFELLQSYLKDVTKLYSEQKAVRIKRIVDRKRMIRLVPEGRREGSVNPSLEPLQQGDRVVTTATAETRPESTSPEESSPNSLTRTTGNSNQNGPSSATVYNPETYNEELGYDSALTSEEVEMLEQENAVMLDHMSSLVDEVRLIEGKVVEVTKLQEVFAEHVLKQSDLLDMVHTDTITTTENIKEGNEQIRNAIRNLGSFRLWILFILVVCSFTLLFLDWYQ